MTFTNNFSKYKLIVLMCVLLSLPMAMMAWDQTEYGANVTNEQRDQNTPSGWTAVSLPKITINGEHNITTYGASTSSSDNSTAINNAITAANTAGGGIVIIPAGTWMVANPLDMKSNVVLHLSANCTLKMQPKGTYPAGKENYLISNRTESSTSNIIIEGEGETSVIDGNGADWWPNYKSSATADIRPGSIIRIKKGSKHIYRNFKITMAPQTNLTIGQSGNVSNVTVHDIIIKNPAAESDLATADGYSTISHNTDGMPVWANHVNIYNCDINTGDDNIVCDDGGYFVHAWNIKCGRGHGMSVGSNTKRVHDIIYENITFNGTTSGFRIKSTYNKSGNDQSGTDTYGAVKNIICRNATMTGVYNPIKITSWYDDDKEDASVVKDSTEVTATTPEFCNITFQNITADIANSTSWKHGAPVYIYGRPTLKIHDITLDNVKINSKVRMYLAYCKDVTFKNKCNIQKSGSTTSPYTYEASYSGNYDGTTNATYDDAGTSPVYFNVGDYTYYTTTVLNGQTVSQPTTNPTYGTKTFKGWATSKTSTSTVTFPYTISAATTFYAVWDGESGSGSGESEYTGTNISLRFTSADGDITSSTTYCTSFSVVGASGKAINIASSSKTIDGVSFTHCAKMGGTGNASYRYISFPVTGDCAIKVYGGTSSNNTERNLTIASGSSALGTALKTNLCSSTTDPVAETYNYTGNATTIYVYSTNSGYNIYGIDVTYASTSGGDSGSSSEESSQDTSKDKTLGNNTYTIASGDKAVSGTKITGTDITMTYGDDTWKDAATESTTPSGYTYYITGSVNPNNSGSVPTSGCYYRFEPTADGTLNVAMLVNASKSIYVIENGTSIGYSIGGTAYSAGSSLDSKTGDILSFPVTSGKTYYVYCAGSKLGLFGWTLTSGSGSSSSTGSTVTGTETTPTATASGVDQVGLCYTIPATYVGGQGNSSKAIKYNLRNDVIEINVNPNYTITGFTFTGNDNYTTNGITISSVTVDGGSTNVLSSSTTFATDKSENSFTVSNIEAASKITLTASTPHDNQLNGTIVFTYKYNVQALALSSSSTTTSRNGSVTLKFNNPMAASTATATIGTKTFRPYVSGTTVTYAYSGLDYGQTYSFSLPAGSLTDEFGQTYNQAINLTITTAARATVTKKAFDKVVSTAQELAEAIKAANDRSDKTTRYRIFCKPGVTYQLPTLATYQSGTGATTKTVSITLSDNTTQSKTFDNPTTYLEAANVSIIGADYSTTTITNTVPTEEYTGKYGTANIAEGIGNGDVLQISKNATGSYFQGVTIKTAMGDAKGRDIAVNDQSNKTIMKDVCLWGYQDTYVSNNSGGRFYFDGGILRGRTDYLCGKGDVYYNKVTLQQCGTGGYLAVPSVPMKYGYIFNECYIKSETSDVTYYLGRPWGSGTPIALFINTKVDTAPIAAGWAEMSGGWPARFAEYNTKTTSGSSVSTSSRKTTYNTSYTCDPVLTQAEAELYSTMSLSMSGSDGWDPTEYTEQCSKPTASLSGSTLSWTADNYASSWIVFKDGDYYANPTTNSLSLTEEGSYTVRAANAMGGLGEASSAVSYVDDTQGTVAATVKMTYVDGSNTTTSYGEVTEAKAGYNNISNNAVGLQYSGWNCNWITYIKVDASNVPANRYIKKATLTAKVSGSTDSKRITTWGAGYNSSTWSSTMTYETADKSITTCGDTYTTSTKSATTFEDVTFDISDALVGDADKVATILIYETAAAGGYIKDVSVSVEYTNVETHTHTYGTPSWTWADDGKTASAQITCTKDASHVLSGNATVTSAVQTAATCTAMGTTRYTATITLNNTQYSAYKDVTDIAMAQHNYTYTDIGDGTHTKACSTCTVNSVESHTGACTGCNIYMLVDGTAYTNMQDAQYDKVYYQRTFPNTTWNALCVPFAINVTDYTDQFDIAEVFAFCPYKDTNKDGNVTAEDDDMLIVFKKTSGSTVPGKPYLIRPKSATKYIITAEDGQLYSATAGSVECATTKTTYTITGLYSPVSATPENRYYYVTANGIGYRTSGSTTVGAYRWFMVPEANDSYSASASSSAKTYGIVVIGEDLDDATAVQLVNANKTTADGGAVYTIQGVKVSEGKTLAPGIYIKNGHKFMVK